MKGNFIDTSSGSPSCVTKQKVLSTTKNHLAVV